MENDIVWSEDGENFNCNSLEEVIDNLRGYLEDSYIVGVTVMQGVVAKPSASEFVDADWVVDCIGEVAYDNYGDVAEDFPYVTKEAKAELDALLVAWVEKNLNINFYKVVDTQNYTITKEDLE